MTLIPLGKDGEVSPTGGYIVQGTDGSGNAQRLHVDTDGDLQVDVLTGGGGGTQYTEGDVDASITGTAMMMEGAANVLVAAQGTAADGLLVNLGSNNDVTVTGTVTANAGTNLNTSLLALEAGGNLANSAASLSVMDDWDETNRAAVNTIAGQVGVQGGSGTSTALTQRVVLATDVALPTGSNVIGALTANQSVNVAQINGVAPTMGNGVSGTGVQRVTIASDSTGQVALATGSNTIGALTANQSVNTAQINGVAPTMGNGVSGTGVQRVTIASDSTGQVSLATGSNTIGKLAASDGVDIGDVSLNNLNMTIVSTGGSAASSGNNTLVSADASNRIKVFAFSLTTTSTTAVTCIFQDGASGTELWRCILQAPSSVNTGANLAVSPPAWLFATSTNTLLNLNLSAAQTVHWALAYFKQSS